MKKKSVKTHKNNTGAQDDVNRRERTEEKLRHEEQRFRAFVEHSSDIIVLLNLEGIITYINPAVEKVLGFKPEERIGTKGFELIHPDDRKFLADSFNTLATDTNSPVIRGDLHLRHKDGSWRTLEAVGSNLVNNNVVEAIIVNYRDITKRKEAESERETALEALRESEELFRNYMEFAPDGVYMSDMKGNFLYGNRRCEEIIGYRREDLIGKNFLEVNLLTEKSLNKAVQLLQANMEGKPTGPDEIELISKEGRLIPVEINTSVVQRMGQGIILAFVRDITDRKLAEEALRESEHRYQELSIIDDLTQLYNSRHFHAQLEREIERSNRYGQPLTLLLLDIDKFKKFNDKYGHVEGDYVLSRLGQLVKRCLRETDSAYRYGGEEFTIMLPMTTSEEGIVTAKRIQTELKKEVFYPVLGQEVNITVSIGLAQYKTKEEMKAFVQRVDKLMYQAKKDGRNRICPDRIRYKHRAIGSS